MLQATETQHGRGTRGAVIEVHALTLNETVEKITYQLVEKAGLKDSRDALITSAQEQTLNTRSMEAWVYHIRQDLRCRLCKEAPETV